MQFELVSVFDRLNKAFSDGLNDTLREPEDAHVDLAHLALARSSSTLQATGAKIDLLSIKDNIGEHFIKITEKLSNRYEDHQSRLLKWTGLKTWLVCGEKVHIVLHSQ